MLNPLHQSAQRGEVQKYKSEREHNHDPKLTLKGLDFNPG
jgi:hypothetical protein